MNFIFGAEIGNSGKSHKLQKLINSGIVKWVKSLEMNQDPVQTTLATWTGLEIQLCYNHSVENEVFH